MLDHGIPQKITGVGTQARAIYPTMLDKAQACGEYKNNA